MRLAFREDDLSHPQVRALVRLHLEGMHANSPPGSVFALDLSGLTAPGVTVWGAWSDTVANSGADGALAGIGALRVLGPAHGEIKSMRTHPAFLRRGVAAALLEHIIAGARTRGVARLSLETGSGPAFEPALSLYRRRGFVEGEAFGGYTPSQFNALYHLDLGERGRTS
jgi:putative acetyltransferase